MKKLLFTLLSVSTSLWASSQAAYVLPSPTAADEPLTLYIDLNQTTYTGLKDRVLANPSYRDSVYLWTWQPSGPTVGNGEWGNSNPALRLNWEGGLLFSITFIPTQFYGVDGPTFFARGISCLAKLDNGNAFPEVNTLEAKTEDLQVTIIPKLCDKLYCAFPEIARADDYLSITYDNTKETRPELQNMGPDDCYIYLYASYAPFQGVEYAPESQVTSTQALKLRPVSGRPGVFRITIAPSDFFAIPEGQTVDFLNYYILRPGFTYQGIGIPPIQGYTFVSCQ